MKKPPILTRRSAIQHALAVFGGTVTATQFGLLTKSVAAMSDDTAPSFLQENQFQLLRQVVDQIIPATDTPGAVDAGVHQFIDLMLSEWASPGRQARYVTGLDEIELRAQSLFAASFTMVSEAQQVELLHKLDDEAFADDARDVFFAELKKMILFSYYSSEVGATIELRFQRMPGDYLPCVPMNEIGRAWFWNGYAYRL